MKRALLIVAITLLGILGLMHIRNAPAAPAGAQGDHCGNGLAPRFQLGNLGRVNREILEKAEDLNHYDYINLSAKEGVYPPPIFPGEYFIVTNGPQCSADGISLWEIDNSGQWIAEGDNNQYYIEPVNLNTDGTSYFQTRIHLEPSAPIIDASEQIRFFLDAHPGALFCGAELPKLPMFSNYLERIEFSDEGTFNFGEPIQVSLYGPDGTLHYNEHVESMMPDPGCGQEGGEVYSSWSFIPSDPGGEWAIKFADNHEHVATYTTTLLPQYLPWMDHYCENEEYVLVLDGFVPNEILELKLIEVLTRQWDSLNGHTGKVDIVNVWQVTVDNQGQLLVTFSDDITHSSLRHFVITRSDGYQLNADLDFNYKGVFSSCNSDYQRVVTSFDLSSYYFPITVPYVESFSIEAPNPLHFVFEGESNRVVTIRAEHVFYDENPESDLVLQLFGPDGELLIENDDANDQSTVQGQFDALIDAFVLPETGSYTVVVKTLEEYDSGKLTIEYQGSTSSGADQVLDNVQMQYGQTIESTITGEDGETWIFAGSEGDAIIAAVVSSAFDSYLELIDEDGKVLVSDDDSGAGTNAQIDGYTIPHGGLYTLVVSGIGGKGGAYMLTLNLTSSSTQPITTLTSVPTLLPQPTNTAHPTQPPDICPGLAIPRLTPGGQGRVIDSEPNNIRDQIGSRNILGQIPPGAIFNVLDGPECPSSAQNVWYRVEYNGITGWTAEGYGGIYWLEPVR